MNTLGLCDVCHKIKSLSTLPIKGKKLSIDLSVCDECIADGITIPGEFVKYLNTGNTP